MKEIGFVASTIGVSSSTLRRWERNGILPFEVERDGYGRRGFSDDQVLVLIKIRNEMSERIHQQLKPKQGGRKNEK